MAAAKGKRWVVFWKEPITILEDNKIRSMRITKWIFATDLRRGLTAYEAWYKTQATTKRHFSNVRCIRLVDYGG